MINIQGQKNPLKYFFIFFSRTQTPTNSDSPVPSLHNDDIRKRVLEELSQQENSIQVREAAKKFFFLVDSPLKGGRG